jgi:chromosome segregation ATPase
MMSGTLYAITEILIFMVVATVIGYLLGAMITRRRNPSLAKSRLASTEAGLLEKRLTASEGEREALAAEREKLKTEITQLRAAVTESAVDDGMRAQLEESRQQVELLERDLSAARAAGAEAASDGRATQQAAAELAESRRQVEVLQRDLAAAQAAAAEAAAGDDTAEQLVASRERIQDLEQLLSGAETTIGSLTADRDQLAEKLRDSESQAEEASSQDDEAERLRAELDRVNAELAERDRVMAELDRATDAPVVVPPAPEAPASGFSSSGAGAFADSAIEFDTWDPRA